MANLSKKMNKEITWEERIEIAEKLLLDSVFNFAHESTTEAVAKTMKNSYSDRMLSAIDQFVLDDGKVIVRVTLNTLRYNNRTHTAVYSLHIIGLKGKHAIDKLVFDTKGSYADAMTILDVMDDVVEAMSDYGYSLYCKLTAGH